MGAGAFLNLYDISIKVTHLSELRHKSVYLRKEGIVLRYLATVILRTNLAILISFVVFMAIYLKTCSPLYTITISSYQVGTFIVSDLVSHRLLQVLVYPESTQIEA